MSDPIDTIEERLGKFDQANPDGTHINPNISTLVSGVKELAKMKARKNSGANWGITCTQVKPTGIM